MKTINKLTGFFLLIFSTSCFNPMLCAQENDRSGHDLPFEETWAHGSFTFYQWTPSENWAIDTEEGNPAPTAVFSGTPQLSDYSCPLTSYTLNTAEYENGDIILSYDIKLNSVTQSGTEYLNVSIITDSASYEIKSFVNDSTFDWINITYNMGMIMRGEDIKVEFSAVGENSDNISNWMIDNISVIRNCPYPKNLEIDHFETEVYLFWAAYDSLLQQYLDYNDNTFENEFASNNGGSGLAQRFTLSDWPVRVKKVRYWNSDLMGYSQTEEIYILSGDGAVILGGPYSVNDGPAADWVEIDIDPVIIDESAFLVATINSEPNGPYVGVDDSFYNATLFFGTIGDWTELSELGPYYYVGSHEVIVEMEIEENKTSNTYTISPNHLKSVNMDYHFTQSTKGEFWGYNIYKRSHIGEFEKINEEPWQECHYTDYEYYGGSYWYYVTAVFDDCIGYSDTVYLEILPGIEDYKDQDVIVTPNPANNTLSISCESQINKIVLGTYNGQTIATINGNNQKEIRINTEGYKAGIYFVIVETEAGSISRKLSIVH